MAGSSRRQALTKGLILGGLAGCVGTALGQSPPAEPSKPEPPSAPPAALGTKVGTINLGRVWEEVDRIKTQGEQFKKDAAGRRRELAKMAEKIRAEIEHKNSLPPGSEAHGQSEARIAQLQKELQKARAKIEKDFARRQSELVATLYQEIQEAVGTIAKRRGLSMILKISDPPKTTDQTALASIFISQNVVYADPALEITREVIAKLNRGG